MASALVVFMMGVVMVVVVVVVVVVVLLMMVTYGKDRKGNCEGDEGDIRARDAIWAAWIRFFQLNLFVLENVCM